MYHLYIKVVNPDVKEYYESKLLRKHHGDSGFDLICPNLLIRGFHKSDGLAKIDLGIQCQLYNKTTQKFVSYLLMPRSSIIKTPLRMANSIGLIDAGYQGNLIAAVDCLEQYWELIPGFCLFQLVAPNLEPIESFEIVEDFGYITSRGDGAFGSTGKN